MVKNEPTKNTKSKVKGTKIINIFNIIYISIFLLVSIVLFHFIFKINILPTKYLLGIIVLYLIATLISILLVTRKNIIVKIIGIILIALMMIVDTTGIYYLYNTNKLFTNIKNIKETKVYYVLVNKKDNYKSIDELKGKNIGLYSLEKDNYNKAIKELDNLVENKHKKYDDFNEYVEDLLNGKTKAILINSSTKEIMDENNENFKNNTEVLEKIKIDVITKEEKVKLNDDKLNILISGIDTFGEINTTSRSDVNIIVTVNKNTNQIVLTTTPRDMEVKLHGTEGLTDKLTHAGIYGADMSRQTLEDFYDIEIPYYVRVNFTSVEQIVDAIGGIDIYNDIEFGNGQYYYPKGNIHLNGKKALGYARNRYQQPSGDYNRGLHQEEIIKGIITKVTHSTELLTNYAEITNSLSHLFQTNIPDSLLKKYIKNQLDKMPEWEINYYSVGGGPEDHKYTYSAPNIKLYIITPYEPEIKRTHEIITGILNDKKYSDISDRFFK